MQLIAYNTEDSADNGGARSKQGNGPSQLGKDILVQWLEECKAELQRLVDELDKTAGEQQRVRKLAEKAIWPLKR